MITRYGYGRYGGQSADSTDSTQSTFERVRTLLTTVYGSDRVVVESQLPGSQYRPDFQVELPPTRLVVETVDDRAQLDSAVGQITKYGRVTRQYLPVLAVPESLLEEAMRRVPDAVALIAV